MRKASLGRLRNDYICHQCRDVWPVVAAKGTKGVGLRKLERRGPHDAAGYLSCAGAYPKPLTW